MPFLKVVHSIHVALKCLKNADRSGLNWLRFRLCRMQQPKWLEKLVLAAPAGLETFTAQEAALLKQYATPAFFKQHQIEVASSLPSYSKDRTDRQRGDGVFEDSIKALQMLNAVGYGVEGTGLILNLVYNPAGAFLPAPQNALEKEYKAALKKDFGIVFNSLFTITNMPISRYLDYLLQTENYEKYMEKLIAAFNPAAAANVMCRTTLSIGWDGYIYDCDFNQMLEMKVSCKESQHLSTFNAAALTNREIIINQHCYGCTAGMGSSCGGAVA